MSNSTSTDDATTMMPAPPTSMITARLAEETHAMLKKLAHRRETSLNQLCVSVLQAELDKEAAEQP